jgi:hypothetical protein
VENVFDTADFINRLKRGEFDGRLTEELGSLSRDQLELLTRLMEVQPTITGNSPTKIP